MDRYRKCLPSLNKHLTRRRNIRAQNIHKEKLQKIRSMVDTSAPKSMDLSHMKFNPNKKEMQDQKFATIQNENRVLLEKIGRIMVKGDDMLDHKSQAAKYSRSLNLRPRKDEYARITASNMELLERLKTTKSKIDLDELEANFQRFTTYSRNMNQYKTSKSRTEARQQRPRKSRSSYIKNHPFTKAFAKQAKLPPKPTSPYRTHFGIVHDGGMAERFDMTRPSTAPNRSTTSRRMRSPGVQPLTQSSRQPQSSERKKLFSSTPTDKTVHQPEKTEVDVTVGPAEVEATSPLKEEPKNFQTETSVSKSEDEANMLSESETKPKSSSQDELSQVESSSVNVLVDTTDEVKNVRLSDEKGKVLEGKGSKAQEQGTGDLESRLDVDTVVENEVSVIKDSNLAVEEGEQNMGAAESDTASGLISKEDGPRWKSPTWAPAWRQQVGAFLFTPVQTKTETVS